MRPRNSHKKRSGFTLIEVATSLSVISVLLLGLSSAVMIGSHAIPSTTDTGIADQAVIDALNQYRSDLREAVTIKHRSNGSGSEIQLVMKDAGAAGSPAKVVYTYSNISETLVRKVDLLDDVTVMSGIKSFAVSLSQDGADANVVYTLLVASDTIQTTFEVHVALPYKPEVI
ncbi:hypothetical protein COB72_02120 [bacterium]|nr:MAG: hypothetical protein COB72_02120 [bacterium]